MLDKIINVTVGAGCHDDVRQWSSTIGCQECPRLLKAAHTGKKQAEIFDLNCSPVN